MTSPVPDDAPARDRIAALQRIGLLDAPTRPAFDHLTRLAARIAAAPLALLSLLTPDRQRVISCVGLPEPLATTREVPLSRSLCQYVVATAQPLIVENARQHPALAISPAVVEHGVVAYAGFPLAARAGCILGVLAVIDRQPRRWTPDECATLRDIAAIISGELQLLDELSDHALLASQLHAAQTALETQIAERTAQLANTHAGLHALMASAPDAIVVTDDAGRMLAWNERARRLFGYGVDEILGQPITMIIPTTLHALDARRRAPAEARSEPHEVVELQGRRRDGSYVPIELSSARWEADGQTFWSGFLRDITARKQIETELRASEQDYRRLFEHAHDAILIFDPEDEQVLDANQRACEIYGFSRDELIGLSLQAISLDPVGGRIYVNQTLQLGMSAKFESVQRRKDGTTMFLEINAAAVEYRGRRSILSVNRDITERVTAAATIQRMANYDALTGLPNRELFYDRVQQALAAQSRSGVALAVMCIGLSRFGLINDTLGHAGGDEVLRIVAQRLSGSLRAGDSIARLAGDEFGVLFPAIAGPQLVTDMVQRLIETIGRPIMVGGHELTIVANIGISMSPTDGTAAAQLVTRATTAMARAKRSRDHRFQFFALAMNQDAQRQLALEENLRRALRAEEFVVWYQPQIELATGRLVGYEALVRWHHPEHGLIAPGDFVALAEETGLIVPLGAWVLREACRQTAAWHAGGRPELRIAVNISARQFHQSGLAGLVRETLEETHLAPSALELEITESMLMADGERTQALLHELRAIGVQLAMDDFGTGYSSLAQLKRFPITTLKIDRSFVRHLAESERDAAIVAGIISLAHTLGLTVVGEGVESAAQAEFLARHGCEIGQGYLWDGPRPAADMLIETSRPQPALPEPALLPAE